jgi:hypothetical protein
VGHFLICATTSTSRYSEATIVINVRPAHIRHNAPGHAVLRLGICYTLDVRQAQVQGLRAMQVEARKRVKERAICTPLLCAALILSTVIFSACAPRTVSRTPPVVGE